MIARAYRAMDQDKEAKRRCEDERQYARKTGAIRTKRTERRAQAAEMRRADRRRNRHIKDRNIQ